MEEETEVLDWGNEDDEQNHDLLRNGPLADFDTRRDPDEGGDVEDSVSLGDEDEQPYFDLEPRTPNGSAAVEHGTREASYKRAVTPKLVTKTDQAEKSSHDLEQKDSSISQKQNSNDSSPQRRRRSLSQRRSPQRPTTLTTPARLTHALPPKPVATSVPYLPPSHPSIVEATAMAIRAANRDSKKQNGGSVSGSKSRSSLTLDTDQPLPPDWEVRHARSGNGVYYYNVQTHMSTWIRPVSSISSPSSYQESRSPTRLRRASSVSTGGRLPSPHRSDQHPPQSSHLARESNSPEGHVGAEPKVVPQTKAPPDPASLSYEDRHYRPGNSSAVSPQEIRRNETPDIRHGAQSHASKPPLSPPRERARSLSPRPADMGVPMQRGRHRNSRPPRGSQRSGRGHVDVTNTPHSTQRNRESNLVTSENAGRPWQPPTPKYDNKVERDAHHQEQNHQTDYTSYEPSAPEDRSRVMNRSQSNTGAMRGRELSRGVEAHDLIPSQNSSTSRHRSPSNKQHERIYDKRDQEANQVTPQLDVSVPPPSKSRRERPSRFDRPTASPAIPALRVSTVISTSTGRHHEDEHQPPDSGYSRHRDGDRDHDRGRDSREERDVLTRNPILQQPASASLMEAPQSYSSHGRDANHEYGREELQRPSDYARVSPDLSHPSLRKRAPLPPQSAKYREMGLTAAPPDIENEKTYRNRELPRVTAFLNAHSVGREESRHGSKVIGDNLPPVPRHQHYTPPTEEYNIPRNNHGIHPGPPNSRDYDGGRDRYSRHGSHHPTATYVMPPDVMDVDHENIPTSSRYPPERDSDALKSSSGMYDRDSASADTPTAPRAMTVRTPSSSTTAHPPPLSTPISPNMSYGYNKDREPSPPHFRPNAYETRRDYDVRQESHVWRDDRHYQSYHSGDREYRDDPQRRPSDSSRLIPSAVSGPNDAPVANRRPNSIGDIGSTREYYSQNPYPQDGPVSNTRTSEQISTRRSDLPPGKSSYERPPHIAKAVEKYRPHSFDSQDHRQSHPSPNFERPSPLLPTAEPSRSRKDSRLTANERRSRFDRSTLSDPNAPRTWTPREPSPKQDPIPRVEFKPRNDYPVEALQQTSRDRTTLPPWKDSEYSRSGRHPRDDYQRGDRRDNVPLPDMDIDARTPRDAEEIPSRYHSDRRRQNVDEMGMNQYESRYPEVPRPDNIPPSIHPPPEVARRKVGPDVRTPDLQTDQTRPRWSDPVREMPPRQSDNHHVQMPPSLPPRPEPEFPESRGSKPGRQRRPPNSNYENPRVEFPYPPAPMQYPPDDNRNDQHLDRSERPTLSRRGGSLLDRLTLDDSRDQVYGDASLQSLRERVQVPSKRDREDMVTLEPHYDVVEGEEGLDPATKRPRRRSGKPRRGGRRGGGGGNGGNAA